jgi:transcriptional regulator with XRE-family HTH domain
MAARGRRTDGKGGVVYGDQDFNYEYKREFGRILREMRLNQGLTQLEVGNAMGVTLSAISNWEKGTTGLPADKIEAAAEIFQVDKEEFARLYLRWTNPWAYKLIFHSRDRRLLEDLASIPSRVGVNPALAARTKK